MEIRYIALSLIILVLGCGRGIDLELEGGDGQIEFAILQINDVYEIAGVDKGRQGDLSRVAHYYKQVKTRYPQSMLVLSGDFLNPSLIGTMKYEGERIKGRQMVEVLNAMQLDLATFGNHEFDIDLEDLQKRLNESEFDWMATNVWTYHNGEPEPFYKEREGVRTDIPEVYIKEFVDADGTSIRVGFFGALTPVNRVDYVTYSEPMETALSAIEELRKQCDLVLGLTHLDIADDVELAKQVSDVPLFVGGHDHDNMLVRENDVVIAKADANAKTVYEHIVKVDSKGRVSVKSTLVPMNESVPYDPEVRSVILKWNDIMEANVSQVVAEPYEVVYVAKDPLDGRESTIRHQQCELGRLITAAMLNQSVNNARGAMLNSGAIRIDDQISGEISALDVFRALPFGGQIYDVTLTGKLLIEALDYSEGSKGSGGYLQLNGMTPC